MQVTIHFFLITNSNLADIASRIGDDAYEFGISTTSGSTRTITLKGNYTDILFFDLCYTTSLSVYPPRDIQFIAPNTITFSLNSATTGAVSYEYTLPYVFVGVK